MVKFLVYLKHNFKILWKLIEALNGFLFGFLYQKSVFNALNDRVSALSAEKYEWRFLRASDLPELARFFQNQPQDQFQYFKPHGFSLSEIENIFRNPSFFMLGVFDKERLVGYFFLRCFLNKKCFTGRIVSAEKQGEGLSKTMGRVLIDSAWAAGFRVFGTASKSNVKSLGSYRSINKMNVIKELSGGYVLFEYIKDK